MIVIPTVASQPCQTPIAEETINFIVTQQLMLRPFDGIQVDTLLDELP